MAPHIVLDLEVKRTAPIYTCTVSLTPHPTLTYHLALSSPEGGACQVTTFCICALYKYLNSAGHHQVRIWLPRYYKYRSVSDNSPLHTSPKQFTPSHAVTCRLCRNQLACWRDCREETALQGLLPANSEWQFLYLSGSRLPYQRGFLPKACASVSHCQ